MLTNRQDQIVNVEATTLAQLLKLNCSIQFRTMFFIFILANGKLAGQYALINQLFGLN